MIGSRILKSQAPIKGDRIEAWRVGAVGKKLPVVAGECAKCAQPSTIDVDDPTHRFNKAANSKAWSKKSLKMLVIKTEHAADDIFRARTRARPDGHVSSAMAEWAGNALGI